MSATEPIYAALAAAHAPARAARHAATLRDLDTAWAALTTAEHTLREDLADHGPGATEATRAILGAVTTARSHVMWAGTTLTEATTPVDLPRRLTRTWGDPAPAWDQIIGDHMPPRQTPWMGLCTTCGRVDRGYGCRCGGEAA